MNIKKIENAELKNKKVIVRVDYNVPLKKGEVQDPTRLVESLPTLKYLLAQNCKVILISHLGRPDGKPNPELSLKPVAEKLSSLLKKPVLSASDCVGPETAKLCADLKSGQIILLENLRFHAEEEKNDEKFARELAGLAEVFISDAFGTAHRAHASTVGITKFLPSYAGLLMEKEVEKLSETQINPPRPLTLVIGGAKMETKIDLIKSFIDRSDNIILGGGIANTFLAAKGYQIGASLMEKDKVEIAKEIIKLVEQKRKNLLLPVDFLVAKAITEFAGTKVSESTSLEDDDKIVDMGPQTVKIAKDLLHKSQTIIWNGPMGIFEMDNFAAGTKAIAKEISESTTRSPHHLTVIGGGDTLEALNRFKIPHSKFSHVSTGGGAMLEFLEKGTLPGVEALK